MDIYHCLILDYDWKLRSFQASRIKRQVNALSYIWFPVSKCSTWVPIPNLCGLLSIANIASWNFWYGYQLQNYKKSDINQIFNRKSERKTNFMYIVSLNSIQLFRNRQCHFKIPHDRVTNVHWCGVVIPMIRRSHVIFMKIQSMNIYNPYFH